MRETKLYGSYLELIRNYVVLMDQPKINITDTIENIGFRTAPVMILYHFNLGYPLLDENTELLSGKSKVTPTDYGDSKKDFKQYDKFSFPIKDYDFQVFYHDIEPDADNYSNVALVNKSYNNGQGIGIRLRYNKDSLPYLIQWKYLAEGEYVCGLEPANSLVRGRNIEREEGNLKTLEPGEKITFNLEIKILESNQEIYRFRKENC